MKQESPPTLQEMAARRAAYLTGLMWHAGSFVIINIFFWALDLLDFAGVNWSLWITGFWGFGLAFHALAYLIDGRQMKDRKTRQYLDEAERRDGGSG